MEDGRMDGRKDIRSIIPNMNYFPRNGWRGDPAYPKLY